MNKKFFEGMAAFASVFLLVGILCSAILAFTTLIKEVTWGTYSNYTETVFNPLGLVGVLACLSFSIAMYYILKSIALFGLRPYEDKSDGADSDSVDVQTNIQDVDDKGISVEEKQKKIY